MVFLRRSREGSRAPIEGWGFHRAETLLPLSCRAGRVWGVDDKDFSFTFFKLPELMIFLMATDVSLLLWTNVYEGNIQSQVGIRIT